MGWHSSALCIYFACFEGALALERFASHTHLHAYIHGWLIYIHHCQAGGRLLTNLGFRLHRHGYSTWHNGTIRAIRNDYPGLPRVVVICYPVASAHAHTSRAIIGPYGTVLSISDFGILRGGNYIFWGITMRWNIPPTGSSLSTHPTLRVKGLITQSQEARFC